MYTQCPDCGTVFRVTSDALRVAQGAVRCGVCSTSFNALDSLRDDPRPLLLDEVPPEDTITVEELPGNEMIELSSPEAEAASAPAADEAADETSAPGTGDRPPEELVADAAAETEAAEAVEIEFLRHAEDDELQLAMERASQADLSGIEVHEDSAFFAPGARLDDLERTDEFPILVLDESSVGDESDSAPPAMRLVEGAQLEGTEARTASGSGPAPVAEAGPATGPAEEPRFLIPEELRRDLQAGAASESDRNAGRHDGDTLGLSPDDDEEARRRWPWVALAALLLVAIGAQAVHFWRDDLARDPIAGPWVLRAYDALGLPLRSPADLSALELRQWGATSDATQPGRLRLRASIVNRAAFAQPYPLLRLSLQDRFGNTIGARDVEPADYLPGGAASTPRLLGPGQRADAEIVFVDPGRDAVGYELDLCLPAGDGLRCANAAAAAAP